MKGVLTIARTFFALIGVIVVKFIETKRAFGTRLPLDWNKQRRTLGFTQPL